MSQPTIREIYFYLSHARGSTSVPDHWVQTFHAHLIEEVRRLARSDTDMDIGFADFEFVGEDRESRVALALNAAHVLIVLYSPEYLPLPSRARVTFERRLEHAAAERAAQHIQPVLWAPITSDRQPVDLAAAHALGADFPEYAEIGVRAMCRLTSHSAHYADLVSRLASRVVKIAERDPLKPTTAGSLVDPSPIASADASFVIAVIAPVEGQLPTGREERQYYDTRAVNWRPFPNRHAVPIAEHTAEIAEIMMLPGASIVEFAAGETSLETCPGVILIDPWILERPGGLHLLRAAFAALRRQWTTVMIVVDRLDPQYDERGRELASRAMEMGGHARGLKLTRDADEFDAVMVKAVIRSRQRFILARDGLDSVQHQQQLKREEER